MKKCVFTKSKWTQSWSSLSLNGRNKLEGNEYTLDISRPTLAYISFYLLPSLLSADKKKSINRLAIWIQSYSIQDVGALKIHACYFNSWQNGVSINICFLCGKSERLKFPPWFAKFGPWSWSWRRLWPVLALRPGTVPPFLLLLFLYKICINWNEFGEMIYYGIEISK